MTRATEDEIRKFVVENFLYGEEKPPLSSDESFLERGIIDSTGVLELTDFLEERYRIYIEDDDLVPDNLDSVNKLVAFVNRKLAGGGAPESAEIPGAG